MQGSNNSTYEESSNNMVVAVHGGAWDIPESLWAASLLGVKEAAINAFCALKEGSSSIDAVEAGVVSMEANPVFDAGRGSVLTSEGTIEESAMIMRGDTLKAGGIAAAKNLLYPVKVARRVMEDTQHILIAGEGANKFAESSGIHQHPVEDLLTEEGKRQLEKYQKYKTAVNVLFNEKKEKFHDTVGCVALDSSGLLSCATSTGGITGQFPGRIGDSAVVGCGGFADNSLGAVSTTGHGESIATVSLANRIMGEMQRGKSAELSGQSALDYMLQKVGGRGGCVVISRDGEVGKCFTTSRMPWAYVKNEAVHWGMNEDQHFSEPFPNR